MWYDNGATGEFDLPAGAVVKQADSGQIVIVTDEGEVSSFGPAFLIVVAVDRMNLLIDGKCFTCLIVGKMDSNERLWALEDHAPK